MTSYCHVYGQDHILSRLARCHWCRWLGFRVAVAHRCSGLQFSDPSFFFFGALSRIVSSMLCLLLWVVEVPIAEAGFTVENAESFERTLMHTASETWGNFKRIRSLISLVTCGLVSLISVIKCRHFRAILAMKHWNSVLGSGLGAF